MIKSSDLRQKEVININDGRRLGLVMDIQYDFTTGRLTHIIVPGGGRFLGLFKTEDDFIIPWSKIKKIGDDVILVDYPTNLDV